MWHKDMKGTNTVGKNGANTLAQCRVARNLQFVKQTNKKKRQSLYSAVKQSAVKTRCAWPWKSPKCLRNTWPSPRAYVWERRTRKLPTAPLLNRIPFMPISEIPSCLHPHTDAVTTHQSWAWFSRCPLNAHLSLIHICISPAVYSQLLLCFISKQGAPNPACLTFKSRHEDYYLLQQLLRGSVHTCHHLSRSSISHTSVTICISMPGNDCALFWWLNLHLICLHISS